MSLPVWETYWKLYEGGQTSTRRPEGSPERENAGRLLQRENSMKLKFRRNSGEESPVLTPCILWSINWKPLPNIWPKMSGCYATRITLSSRVESRVNEGSLRLPEGTSGCRTTTAHETNANALVGFS